MIIMIVRIKRGNVSMRIGRIQFFFVGLGSGSGGRDWGRLGAGLRGEAVGRPHTRFAA